MAIAKAKSGNDVINGGAVVLPVGSGTANYQLDNTARVPHLADVDSLSSTKVAHGRFRSGDWMDNEGSILASASDTNVATSGDAVVNYAATENIAHTIFGISWDYNTDPTASGAAVQVESPSGTVVWGPLPIQNKGAGFFDFDRGLRGAESQQMLVKAIGGGASIRATVAVKGHRLE
jgi:hypothetical protein